MAPSRSFTIFVDEPASPPSSTSALPGPVSTRPALSRVPSRANTPGPLSPLPPPDKENTHPLTGARALGAGVDAKKAALATGAKRKGVLEPKLHAPPAAKKAKGAPMPLGKRRAASVPLPDAGDVAATEAAVEPQAAAKPKSARTRSASASGASGAPAPRKRVAKRTVSARTVPLPLVAEEDAEASAPTAPLSQVEIDARCYDLTVRPLADVSAAYDESAACAPLPKRKAPRLPSERPATRLARSMSLPVAAFGVVRLPTAPAFGPVELAPSASQSTVVSSASDVTLVDAIAPVTDKPAGAEDADDATAVLALLTAPESFSVPPTPALAFADPGFSSASFMPARPASAAMGRVALDTPTRKTLYRSFTFSSPGERVRTASVDRFADLVFAPLA